MAALAAKALALALEVYDCPWVLRPNTACPLLAELLSRADAILDGRFATSDDADGVRLSIETASRGDVGVYTLRASNAGGEGLTRVQLDVDEDGGATSADPPLISGDDPPQFARRLTDLTVKVGTRTRFLVEIKSSTECRVTWYRNERRLLEAERVRLARDGNFWCADVAAVSVDDAGRWTCTAENAGGRASCSAHLNVLVPKAYKRPEFVEELRALLTEQGTVSLECKVVGVPTPVLRWFKDSREIKAGDVFALTANAEDPTSLGTYTCEAVNCMGRAYSSSKVHVVGRSGEGAARPLDSLLSPEPPPIFTKELEDQQVKISEMLTLSCHVVVPPWPKTVVWYNKEGRVEAGDRYHILEDGFGGYLLEASPAEWPDEGEWKCVATSNGGRVGITSCCVAMEVPKNYRKPRFMENLRAVLTEEGLVSFECKVVGFPTPVLSWFKDGQELKPGDVYQLTGTNSLGSYCCIARNCMGQTSSSAELTVEDIQNQLSDEERLQLFSQNQAPKFIAGLKSLEAKIDEPFRFTVKVAIPPDPALYWYRDDQPVDASKRYHIGKEEKGTFYVDIRHLEFLDQAEWKCVAINDFGHSVTSCFLKLIIPRHYKKPRFLENLQAILSDEGAVNLECKVIGVPAPVLKWYKDGEELKPGDIHRIISGQDGTCCLGTYTCEASNCMGIAASSASLLGFDDSMKSKTSKKPEPEQPIQRNLSLSTIHEERTSQMYDTPVGDITLDDKGEISFSFDGKEVSVSLYETPDLTEEEALQIVEMYADQLSENVSEHNLVELPPLRFIKETSTSGNLLMEAIIIDVSPDYFATTEDDLRTEADVEDMSVVDDIAPPQLSLDQDVGGDNYIEKTMAILTEEKSDIPKKISRRKSDSVKSGDDYFSLSREQSISEEKKHEETRLLSDSELQTFASARSSSKLKPNTTQPVSIGTAIESSEIAANIVTSKSYESLPQQDSVVIMKNKRERRGSRSSRRSSSSSEKSLSRQSKESLRFEGKESSKENISELRLEGIQDDLLVISNYLATIHNNIQVCENEIITKSENMSSAATANRSLEIISNLISPVYEIQCIIDVCKEMIGKNDSINSTMKSITKPLKKLQQTLAMIEKCVDITSENKTLVQRTCVSFIGMNQKELQGFISHLNDLVQKMSCMIDQKIITDILSITNDMNNAINISSEAVKAYNLSKAAQEITYSEPSYSRKHLKNTQKAIFALKVPVTSLLTIVNCADEIMEIVSSDSNSSCIIFNEMTTSIQDLQTALEHIEYLSVKENDECLPKYNTHIIENLVESVTSLRNSFEELKIHSDTITENEYVRSALSSVKVSLDEISLQLKKGESETGPIDILQSENKMEVLQKMAQTLIDLENNVQSLESSSKVKITIESFHKSLTKVLENVIQSNVSRKYFSLIEIGEAIRRINHSLKLIDGNAREPLRSIAQTAILLRNKFNETIFEKDLNSKTIEIIDELVINIHLSLNQQKETSLHEKPAQIFEFVNKEIHTEKAIELSTVIENIVASINKIQYLESTDDLKHKNAPKFVNLVPILEDLKVRISVLQSKFVEGCEISSQFIVNSFQEILAKPVQDLNENIIAMNQVALDQTVSQSDSDLVLPNTTIAEPLIELHKALQILQEDVVSQLGDGVSSYHININLASVIHNLHSCIVAVQHDVGIEAVDDMSTLEDVSGIKTHAETLSEDRLILPENEQNIPVELEEQRQIQSPLIVTAKALRSLDEHITILQQPVIIETLEILSHGKDYSLLKIVPTKLQELHSAIEEIFHPVIMEDFNEIPLKLSDKLLAVAEPMFELKQSLSVIDLENIPNYEITTESNESCSLFETVTKFTHELENCINIISPALNSTQETVQISNIVSQLAVVLVGVTEVVAILKPNLHSTESENIKKLEGSVKNFQAVSVPSNRINIDEIRSAVEELYKNVTLVQEDILPYTAFSPDISTEMAVFTEVLDDLQNNIVTLERYDFVDLSSASEILPFESPQFASVIEIQQLSKINNVIEVAEEVLQSRLCSKDIDSTHYLQVEEFFKRCKEQFSVIKSRITKPLTHKRIIKLVEEFKSLKELIKSFTACNSDLLLSQTQNAVLSTFLDASNSCMVDIQASLEEIVHAYSEILFKKPLLIINKVRNQIESQTLDERNSYCDIVEELQQHLDDLLRTTLPYVTELEELVIKELREIIETDVTLGEVDVSEIIDNIKSTLSISSEKHANCNKKETKLFENLLQCFIKHNQCKGALGTGKMLILLKCVGECAQIFDNYLNESSDIIDMKNETKEFKDTIKILVNDVLEPIQMLEAQLKVVQETIIGQEDESVPVDISSTESFVQTIAEIHKSISTIEKQLHSTSSSLKSEDISIIMDVDRSVHSIKASISAIEKHPESVDVASISEPIGRLDSSIHNILTFDIFVEDNNKILQADTLETKQVIAQSTVTEESNIPMETMDDTVKEGSADEINITDEKITNAESSYAVVLKQTVTSCITIESDYTDNLNESAEIVNNPNDDPDEANVSADAAKTQENITPSPIYTGDSNMPTECLVDTIPEKSTEYIINVTKTQENINQSTAYTEDLDIPIESVEETVTKQSCEELIIIKDEKVTSIQSALDFVQADVITSNTQAASDDICNLKKPGLALESKNKFAEAKSLLISLRSQDENQDIVETQETTQSSATTTREQSDIMIDTVEKNYGENIIIKEEKVNVIKSALTTLNTDSVDSMTPESYDTETAEIQEFTSQSIAYTKESNLSIECAVDTVTEQPGETIIIEEEGEAVTSALTVVQMDAFENAEEVESNSLVKLNHLAEILTEPAAIAADANLSRSMAISLQSSKTFIDTSETHENITQSTACTEDPIPLIEHSKFDTMGANTNEDLALQKEVASVVPAEAMIEIDVFESSPEMGSEDTAQAYETIPQSTEYTEESNVAIESVMDHVIQVTDERIIIEEEEEDTSVQSPLAVATVETNFVKVTASIASDNIDNLEKSAEIMNEPEVDSVMEPISVSPSTLAPLKERLEVIAIQETLPTKSTEASKETNFDNVEEQLAKEISITEKETIDAQFSLNTVHKNIIEGTTIIKLDDTVNIKALEETLTDEAEVESAMANWSHSPFVLVSSQERLDSSEIPKNVSHSTTSTEEVIIPVKNAVHFADIKFGEKNTIIQADLADVETALAVVEINVVENPTIIGSDDSSTHAKSADMLTQPKVEYAVQISSQFPFVITASEEKPGYGEGDHWIYHKEQEDFTSIKHLENALNNIYNKIEQNILLQNNLFDDLDLVDSLDEVQVIIIMLKNKLGANDNYTLIESLEELECNIRSAQLQICNTESQPDIARDAFENLQHFITYFKENCEMNKMENYEITENSLIKCHGLQDQTLQQIIENENMKEFSDILKLNIPEIEQSIKSIQNNMKELRVLFSSNFNKIIARGIDIIQYLDDTELAVLKLQQESENIESIEPNVKYSINSSVIVINESVRSMRKTLSNVQNLVLRDQYAMPFGMILDTIKAFTRLTKTELDEVLIKNIHDYCRYLRESLKHFEDIKFYVNLDKAARYPNESKITKSVLKNLKFSTELLRKEFSRCLIFQGKENIFNDVVVAIEENLKILEYSDYIGVNEKIPVLKKIAESISYLGKSIQIKDDKKDSIITVPENKEVIKHLKEKKNEIPVNVCKFPNNNQSSEIEYREFEPTVGPSVNRETITSILNKEEIYFQLPRVETLKLNQECPVLQAVKNMGIDRQETSNLIGNEIKTLEIAAVINTRLTETERIMKERPDVESQQENMNLILSEQETNKMPSLETAIEDTEPQRLVEVREEFKILASNEEDITEQLCESRNQPRKKTVSPNRELLGEIEKSMQTQHDTPTYSSEEINEDKIEQEQYRLHGENTSKERSENEIVQDKKVEKNIEEDNLQKVGGQANEISISNKETTSIRLKNEKIRMANEDLEQEQEYLPSQNQFETENEIQKQYDEKIEQNVEKEISKSVQRRLQETITIDKLEEQKRRTETDTFNPEQTQFRIVESTIKISEGINVHKEMKDAHNIVIQEGKKTTATKVEENLTKLSEEQDNTRIAENQYATVSSFDQEKLNNENKENVLFGAQMGNVENTATKRLEEELIQIKTRHTGIIGNQQSEESTSTNFKAKMLLNQEQKQEQEEVSVTETIKKNVIYAIEAPNKLHEGKERETVMKTIDEDSIKIEKDVSDIKNTQEEEIVAQSRLEEEIYHRVGEFVKIDARKSVTKDLSDKEYNKETEKSYKMRTHDAHAAIKYLDEESINREIGNGDQTSFQENVVTAIAHPVEDTLKKEVEKGKMRIEEDYPKPQEVSKYLLNEEEIIKQDKDKYDSRRLQDGERATKKLLDENATQNESDTIERLQEVMLERRGDELNRNLVQEEERNEQVKARTEEKIQKQDKEKTDRRVQDEEQHAKTRVDKDMTQNETEHADKIHIEKEEEAVTKVFEVCMPKKEKDKLDNIQRQEEILDAKTSMKEEYNTEEEIVRNLSKNENEHAQQIRIQEEVEDIAKQLEEDMLKKEKDNLDKIQTQEEILNAKKSLEEEYRTEEESRTEDEILRNMAQHETKHIDQIRIQEEEGIAKRLEAEMLKNEKLKLDKIQEGILDAKKPLKDKNYMEEDILRIMAQDEYELAEQIDIQEEKEAIAKRLQEEPLEKENYTEEEIVRNMAKGEYKHAEKISIQEEEAIEKLLKEDTLKKETDKLDKIQTQEEILYAKKLLEEVNHTDKEILRNMAQEKNEQSDQIDIPKEEAITKLLEEDMLQKENDKLDLTQEKTLDIEKPILEENHTEEEIVRNMAQNENERSQQIRIQEEVEDIAKQLEEDMLKKEKDNLDQMQAQEEILNAKKSLEQEYRTEEESRTEDKLNKIHRKEAILDATQLKEENNSKEEQILINIEDDSSKIPIKEKAKKSCDQEIMQKARKCADEIQIRNEEERVALKFLEKGIINEEDKNESDKIPIQQKEEAGVKRFVEGIMNKETDMSDNSDLQIIAKNELVEETLNVEEKVLMTENDEFDISDVSNTIQQEEGLPTKHIKEEMVIDKSELIQMQRKEKIGLKYFEEGIQKNQDTDKTEIQEEGLIAKKPIEKGDLRRQEETLKNTNDESNEHRLIQEEHATKNIHEDEIIQTERKDADKIQIQKEVVATLVSLEQEMLKKEKNESDGKRKEQQELLARKQLEEVTLQNQSEEADKTRKQDETHSTKQKNLTDNLLKDKNRNNKSEKAEQRLIRKDEESTAMRTSKQRLKKSNGEVGQMGLQVDESIIISDKEQKQQNQKDVQAKVKNEQEVVTNRVLEEEKDKKEIKQKNLLDQEAAFRHGDEKLPVIPNKKFKKEIDEAGHCLLKENEGAANKNDKEEHLKREIDSNESINSMQDQEKVEVAKELTDKEYFNKKMQETEKISIQEEEEATIKHIVDEREQTEQKILQEEEEVAKFKRIAEENRQNNEKKARKFYMQKEKDYTTKKQEMEKLENLNIISENKAMLKEEDTKYHLEKNDFEKEKEDAIRKLSNKEGAIKSHIGEKEIHERVGSKKYKAMNLSTDAYSQNFSKQKKEGINYTCEDLDIEGTIHERKMLNAKIPIEEAKNIIHEDRSEKLVIRNYKSHSELRENSTEIYSNPISEKTIRGSLELSEDSLQYKKQRETLSEFRSSGRPSVDNRATRIRDSNRKPVFSTHLTDRTAVEGSRVKLTCSVLTSSDPTVIWYRNGVIVDNRLKYRTKISDGLITLEVLNAVPSDSAEYSCKVSNANGEVSTSANLRVYPSFEASPIPPTFTRSIRDKYHLAEDELVLECRIRGQPLPVITWMKNGDILETTDRYHGCYLADGVCRLTISHPGAEDSGKYTCKAENSMWTDQISHVVEFKGGECSRSPGLNTVEKSRFQRQTMELRRPHFSNILTDHTVPSGGTIGLQVEIRGSPSGVEWLREGRRVTDLFSNARTFMEQELYTLALPDVTEKASGLYTCRAWNTYGKVDMTAAVKVLKSSEMKERKPAIIIGRPEKDILISVGEDINISFRVQGDPKPKVSWLKGSRDISNSYRSCKMTSDDYVMFTLKRSGVSDAGTYCILAKNIYGVDRAFVTVVVRQRASSENLISDWTYPDDGNFSYSDSSRLRNVPAVAGEPVVTDGGNNWVSLTWDKPASRNAAPVLAYKVEYWLIGTEGGARWTELGITPINSYDAFNLKQGEHYHFRVTPRNRYGWGESVQTSNPVGVGMEGNLPEFVEILPGQLKALKGDRATLQCCVRGKPTPQVVWLKNGQELEEIDSRVLTTFNGYECCLVINDVRMEDDARYSCEAVNHIGRVSTYARLSVITDRKIWEADIKLNREISEESSKNSETFPPQFTMRPRDRRVQMTYPVRLTCQVTANPAPSVTWYKDGELLFPDDRRIFSQDEHFHTLEIGQTTLADGGIYEATARNIHGTVSCKCNLVVDKGIRAYISPEFCCGLEPLYTVPECGELRISAVVEAYPSVGVAWHRDGIRLRPSRRTIMTLDRDGSVELAIANITARDAGIYTCTATNEVGRSTTSCKVEVLEEGGDRPKRDVPTLVSPDTPYSKEPMFVKKPRSSEAYEGDTVIIHCEVVGDPKPEVVWLRDFLKPDYYRDASHFRRVGDGPEYRFEIPHAKLDFTGAYSVIAKNCHGEAKAVISLQIYAKGPDSTDSHDITHGNVDVLPSIKRPLNDLRCCDGDSVTFKCLITGKPRPSVRWNKDDKRLETGGDFVSTYEDEEASLNIRTAFPEDQGQYSCVAYNDLGHVATSACLIVDVPEERSNLLSQQLSRPPDLLSAASTPRSTPRATPSRSRATTPIMAEYSHDVMRKQLATSSVSSCLKKTAPKFYAYPHNRVVEEGGTARFQCAVAGHPAPWASWDKDGAPLTATARLTISEKDDVRTVEIEQVTLEDAGLYRIVLENDVGRAEATARLDVIAHHNGARGGVRTYTSPRRSPAVYKHLVGSAIRAGERLRLQAEFHSSSQTKYNWYRNGIEVPNTSNVFKTVDGRMVTLQVENVTTDFTGEYTVTAENDYGISSSFADVAVVKTTERPELGPPIFSSALPAIHTITEGEELKLMCQVDSPIEFKISWYINNVKLSPSHYFKHINYDDHWYALCVNDAYIEDGGTYRCQVESENGISETACTVIVKEDFTVPSNVLEDERRCQFSRVPISVSTYVGSSAIFSCQIANRNAKTDDIQVVWYVAGMEVEKGDLMFHLDHEGPNYDLYILRVGRTMVGEVRCVVRSNNSSRTPLCECSTTLSIIPNIIAFEMPTAVNATIPASLRHLTRDITVSRGGTIKIRALVDGKPKPMITWRKSGYNIRPDFINKFPKYCEVPHHNGAQLLVMRASDEDAGIYNVRVENEGSVVSSVVSVRVIGVPDAPKGKPIVSQANREVFVVWSPPTYDGSRMVTQYRVEMAAVSMMKDHEGYMDLEWKEVAVVKTLIVTVRGLECDETYYFRVKAINAQGAGPPSEVSDPISLEDEDDKSDEQNIVDVKLQSTELYERDYEVMKTLGHGNYGVVKLIKYIATGKKFAAKVIDTHNRCNRENAVNEVKILNKLNHNKLIHLMAAFESPRKIVMVTEFLSGGELFERVSADDFNLTEEDCILFIMQICEGVAYMHRNSVVHLDLKPENIMCKTRTSKLIKIIDFGLARVLNPSEPVNVAYGTRDFISPEVVNYEPVCFETDMWSIGVISYVLLSGLVPFKGETWCETLVSISNVEFDFQDEAFELVSEDAKDFIQKLLVKEPKKRLTSSQSLSHSWIATPPGERKTKINKDKLRKFTIRRKWQHCKIKRCTG